MSTTDFVNEHPAWDQASGAFDLDAGADGIAIIIGMGIGGITIAVGQCAHGEVFSTEAVVSIEEILCSSEAGYE